MRLLPLLFLLALPLPTLPAPSLLQFQPLPPAPTYTLLEVTLTAYNSLPYQTDSTPHITASSTRTRPGVVAVSRDLLRVFPYGTRARILSHTCGTRPPNSHLIVEDTMHRRKQNQVDIWMPSYSQAIQWGRCKGTVKFYE
jgi:3D (Asp-Asp-Asp) domain-containing protein